MQRFSVLALLLASLASGCGYVGYDSVASPLVDGGPDADGDVPDGSDGAVTVCEAASSSDYCATIPSINVDPVIDGDVDCGLVPTAFSAQGWYPTAAEGLPGYVATRFAAAWRPTGIYVYVEVTDPARYQAAFAEGLLYCGDSAEIYLDANGTFDAAPSYDAAGTRQFLARAPAMGTDLERTGEVFVQQTRVGVWNTASFGVFAKPFGYVLEAFITHADLGTSGTFAGGGRVGLNLGVNVSTSDGSPAECGFRIGQYFLRNAVSMADPCFGRPYCDVTSFCTPTLAP